MGWDGIDATADRDTYSSCSHTAYSARWGGLLRWRSLDEVEGLLDLGNALLLLRHDWRQVLQEGSGVVVMVGERR